MFASLKSKIKEETGADLQNLPRRNSRQRGHYPSTLSINSTSEDAGGGHPGEYPHNHVVEELRSQCNELSTTVMELKAQLKSQQEEKSNLEKANDILLETVKVAQTQKDLYCEEQEKIQNMQQYEIDKLKSLLSFREQEAVDRLSAMQQNQQQIENLMGELESLKPLEATVEEVKDELQRVRHATHQERNSLLASLAGAEGECARLRSRVQIMEQARLDALASMSGDEKMLAFMQERKLLEQHLEEAHLQLADIKSSWSGTNLALETQVSRLSKQVAEETTEKRKALKSRDELAERLKQVELQAMTRQEHINERDMKIKLLGEEIEELHQALKQCRDESEQQIIFERKKSESFQVQLDALREQLEALRTRVHTDSQSCQTLHTKNAHLQEQFEAERDEKLSVLLKNAEISQTVEILRKELRMECDEHKEIADKNAKLQSELRTRSQEVQELRATLDELKEALNRNEEKLREIDNLQREVSEKNKTLKMLNQRLSDLKKTVQKEFRHSTSEPLENGGGGGGGIALVPLTKATYPAICEGTSGGSNNGEAGGTIVMDEVNFKYLKHVIVKFLTSREVEARHLVRAVATLLKLTKEEEQLLHDTINWKMSWFGSKPNHGSGRLAISMPPS